MCCIVVINENGMPVKVYGPFNTYTQATEYRESLGFDDNCYVWDITNPH